MLREALYKGTNQHNTISRLLEAPGIRSPGINQWLASSKEEEQTLQPVLRRTWV